MEIHDIINLGSVNGRENMTGIDATFGRLLLAEARKLVKKNFPKINMRTEAWVYHFHRDHWEFHGPDGFYWHGSASNAYEARYKGWMAWLNKMGIAEAA